MLKKFVSDYFNGRLSANTDTKIHISVTLFLIYIVINSAMFFNSDTPSLDRVYCVNGISENASLVEIDCIHRYASIVVVSEYEKNDRIKGAAK